MEAATVFTMTPRIGQRIRDFKSKCDGVVLRFNAQQARIGFDGEMVDVPTKRIRRIGQRWWLDAPADFGVKPPKPERAERKKPGPKPGTVKARPKHRGLSVVEEPAPLVDLGRPLLMEHWEQLAAWGYSRDRVESMARSVGLTLRQVYESLYRKHGEAA